MTADSPVGVGRPPVRAGVRDALRVVAGALVPLAAEGAVSRRRRVSRLAAWTDADGRAARVLQQLAACHGTGPLTVRLPGRLFAVVLDPADVQRLLVGSPSPFTPASRDKVGALAHFQPTGVLVSAGADRPARRRLNVAALDTDLDVHRLGPVVVDIVRTEVAALLRSIGPERLLDWDAFSAAFDRIVRRVVLGDAAGDDVVLTELLSRLRRDANWAAFHPRRPATERAFRDRIEAGLRTAEPDCLAGVLAATARTQGAGPEVDPAGQLPHWLFAYDAAAIACFRALAVLATHDDVRGRVTREADAAAAAAGTEHPLSSSAPAVLPFARSVVLESLRLWPTTLVILRESTAPTGWGGSPETDNPGTDNGDPAGILPAGTTFVVVSSFFHRDPTRLEHADRFEPDVWLDGRAAGSWSLVPFSGGPAGCPGRNLVLLTASTLLATLAEQVTLDLVHATRLRLDPGRPLAATLDHFRLAFRVSARTSTPRPYTRPPATPDTPSAQEGGQSP